MNIAYFGGDWYLDCLDIFKSQGHLIQHIFVNNEQTYNVKLREYASRNKIPVSYEKPTRNQLLLLKNQGVDCVYSSEYPWLIPVSGTRLKSINMHPTLLPNGRGPTPLIWLIQKHHECAGVTFHKLSKEFDSGDIIYQQKISLNTEETWETLVARLHIQVPIYLNELLSNFDIYYENAQPQDNGTYWPKVELNDRTIDWNMKVADIQQLSRACGRFGVVAKFDNLTLLVNHIQTSQCAHQYPPGILIKDDDETYVISASDGIVLLLKRDITERLVKD